jgi:hypothetical protein
MAMGPHDFFSIPRKSLIEHAGTTLTASPTRHPAQISAAIEQVAVRLHCRYLQAYAHRFAHSE